MNKCDFHRGSLYISHINHASPHVSCPDSSLRTVLLCLPVEGVVLVKEAVLLLWTFFTQSLALLHVSLPCFHSLLSLCLERRSLSPSPSRLLSLLLQLSLWWCLWSVCPPLLVWSLKGDLLLSRFLSTELLLERRLVVADPSWVSAVCFCGPVERRVLRRKRLLVLWSGHFNLSEEYFNKTEPVFRHYVN